MTPKIIERCFTEEQLVNEAELFDDPVSSPSSPQDVVIPESLCPASIKLISINPYSPTTCRAQIYQSFDSSLKDDKPVALPEIKKASDDTFTTYTSKKIEHKKLKSNEEFESWIKLGNNINEIFAKTEEKKNMEEILATTRPKVTVRHEIQKTILSRPKYLLSKPKPKSKFL